MENQIDIEDSIASLLHESFNEAETDTESAEAEAPEEVSDSQVVAEAEDGEDTPIEENEVPVEAEEASEDEEPTGIPAPEHWSSEQKEMFESLSPEAQEVLVERDKEFQKGYQERVQGITEIQQALEPWKGMVNQLGVSEAQAIRTLFATYNRLLTDPLNGIQTLAQTFGVQDQLRKQYVPDTDDDFTDPEIKALREQVTGLQDQLQGFASTAEQERMSQVQQDLNNFKTASGDDGKPLHPHFDEALPAITALVSNGKTLEEAYNEAVWSVPAYREAQLKAQPKAPTAEEKAAKVRKAKKAADTTKMSSKTSAKSKEAELSLADELRATWNELAS